MADRTCTAPGCDRPHRARGFCIIHYRRLRRTGRLEWPTVEERFFAHVSEDPNGCWPFDKVNMKGYAAFNVDSTLVEGHRWSYQFFVGEIPEGLSLDHRCHTDALDCPGGSECPHRACVNPWHLEPVPLGTNVLRGVGPAAVNARRTQCVNGHPFTSENTYLTPDGRRQCIACRNRRTRQYQQRRS